MSTSTSGVGWGAAIRGLGVRRGYGTVVALVGTFVVFFYFVPQLVTLATGTKGSFTAARCTPYESRRGSDGFKCSGSFAAADGSFEIAHLSVPTILDEVPTGPVEVATDGPGATEAFVTDTTALLIPGLTALAMIGFAVWNVAGVVRTARGPATPTPAPTPTAEPSAA
ncbi:hypothetical protein ACIRP0_03285 [Streptomyces sp. NPDC101733]|uniref:hypothetical protein n=1 Tax=unclassified Streptomyces TaxID=2593676 RepID=UPI003811E7D9